MSQPQLQAGFANPVEDSQQAFRHLLKVMSEPGVIRPLAAATALDTLTPATFSACQTLLDATTTLWLGGALDTETVRANLGFHSGCRIVVDPAAADFVLARAGELPELMTLRAGTAEYPDRSCTLLVQVEALATTATEQATALRLSGPGIATSRQLGVTGLDTRLTRYLVERPHPFPLGLDLVLLAQDQVAAIPRTTRVEVN
ncbi:phosphonate C-P lyase system protein PhnH [Marichromatium bheemlicum]|uniref:Phosphonate C-P lyase system protein PhnH n=1 Tax=Marichromatium bheemlicum TaxID=365339 RepID=A0ABX1I9W8_9GAMM|nr:phosphonate C-P lyase system protein PhnH [Marichromatium bheemlicum]NKN32970.1 phosphonate C-P lyase system protein PhnH [Marichromatium bheemlicum]